jgi:replication initiation and membrane attachment protein DnaB
MPYFETTPDEIEVDVDDFLSACSDSEKKELVQALKDDGYFNEDDLDNDFDIALRKLVGNSWRLTKEDEETILKIANKIVC